MVYLNFLIMVQLIFSIKCNNIGGDDNSNTTYDNIICDKCDTDKIFEILDSEKNFCLTLLLMGC